MYQAKYFKITFWKNSDSSLKQQYSHEGNHNVSFISCAIQLIIIYKLHIESILFSVFRVFKRHLLKGIFQVTA